MTRSRWLFHLGIIIASVLLLYACGGNDDEDSEEAPAVATPPMETVTAEPADDRTATIETTAAPTATPEPVQAEATATEPPDNAPTATDEVQTPAPPNQGDLLAPIASITVDGDSADWDGIAGLEVTLEPALGLDIPLEDVLFKIAHDGEYIYFLLVVDDDYHWNSTDHHLSVVPAIMWAIDREAGPHMGTDGANIMASLGMVDIWHWELGCALGAQQGGAVHSPGEGFDPGNDGTCSFDDEWATTPFEREDDNDVGAENSLLGVWTHTNPIEAGEGTYTFEIRRPLVTGDVQDAQFASGEVALLAIAYWDPDTNPDEPGWENPEHVQSADQGWIEIVLE